MTDCPKMQTQCCIDFLEYNKPRYNSRCFTVSRRMAVLLMAVALPAVHIYLKTDDCYHLRGVTSIYILQ